MILLENNSKRLQCASVTAEQAVYSIRKIHVRLQEIRSTEEFQRLYDQTIKLAVYEMKRIAKDKSQLHIALVCLTLLRIRIHLSLNDSCWLYSKFNIFPNVICMPSRPDAKLTLFTKSVALRWSFFYIFRSNNPASQYSARPLVSVIVYRQTQRGLNARNAYATLPPHPKYKNGGNSIYP